MKVNHAKPQREADGMAGPENPVAHALLTQETFTRDQVAWLMAEAMRWGYEQRADEENDAYPPRPVFTCGGWFDQAARRDQYDRWARNPRNSDHVGGPVAWDDETSRDFAALVHELAVAR